MSVAGRIEGIKSREMIYLWDRNGILENLRKHFPITEDIKKAKAIFLWTDIYPVEQVIIKYAKSLGVKTFVYQHGRKGSSKYYPPFSEKIQTDKHLVWGEFDRQSLLAAGQDGKKIKVVGSPIFSHLKEKKEYKGINIVFCPDHWDTEILENFRTRDELRKLKGVNIITKLLDTHELKDYDNPIQTDRNDPAHLDKCIEVLQTADLVVGVSESTFELLAQAMDIPVVIMEEWMPKPFGGDMKYLTYRRLISRASKRATIKTLNEIIKQQLKNPHELKEERKQVVKEEGGKNLDWVGLLKKEIYDL